MHLGLELSSFARYLSPAKLTLRETHLERQFATEVRMWLDKIQMFYIGDIAVPYVIC